jgi:hypothetical protein
MDADTLRLVVIRPTLQKIELWSADAEELLIGIAAQETHLGELGRRQMGGGPALGLWQMEGPTYRATMRWAHRERPKLYLGICQLANSLSPEFQLLAENDGFACGVARALCLSIPGPLPEAHDVQTAAVWWKKNWNGPGKGQPAQYIANYTKYVHKTVSVVN